MPAAHHGPLWRLLVSRQLREKRTGMGRKMGGEPSSCLPQLYASPWPCAASLETRMWGSGPRRVAACQAAGGSEGEPAHGPHPAQDGCSQTCSPHRSQRAHLAELGTSEGRMTSAGARGLTNASTVWTLAVTPVVDKPHPGHRASKRPFSAPVSRK